MPSNFESLYRREVIKHKNLIKAVEEWIQWFDYCSEYQKANLVTGQTLESASDNWGSMVTPDPSPSMENLRKAFMISKDK